MYGHWDISKVGHFKPNEYHGFVYCATNLGTGQMYIGKKQITGHRWKHYNTSSKPVNIDIKNGVKYLFEILSLHKSREQLSDAELQLQIKLNVLKALDDNGNRKYYNMAVHGVGFVVPKKRGPMSDAQKLKLSIANTGKIKGAHTEETKKKISIACKGKTRSDQTKLNISIAKKGKTSPNKGKNMSDAQKLKISIAKKGKPTAKKGKKQEPRTDEHRANLSAAVKAYWEKRKSPLLSEDFSIT